MNPQTIRDAFLWRAAVKTFDQSRQVSAEVDTILGLESRGLTSLCLLALGYRGDDEWSRGKKVRMPKEVFVIEA